MSLYNLLFGMNSQAPLLLAVIGLKENDIERFRDVFAEDDGSEIRVYTRTGGGNREGYPNVTMRKRPEWAGSVDDDFDSTYCTDTFTVPEQWREDVKNLRDPLAHGLRAEFMQHLAKTLRREPTEGDKEAGAYDAETRELQRTQHVKANGHTFVPYNDSAMETALKLAEAHDGKLRSAWGILPLRITVERDVIPYPNAKAERDRLYMNRLDIGYEWIIDRDYWRHCEVRWSAAYPKAMAAIREDVEEYIAREDEKASKARPVKIQSV